MAIKESIYIGDWIRAENQESGAIIEGSAGMNLPSHGSALFEILMDVSGLGITINTNFWNIQVIHKNIHSRKMERDRVNKVRELVDDRDRSR